MLYRIFRFAWIHIRPILGLLPFKFYKVLTEWRRIKHTTKFGKSFDKETEIIIEAHARSGNTFAYHALNLAQKRKVKIGHHLHQPNHIIEGIKNNIPVMVIIRHPDDVVASYKIRSSHITIWNGYYSYYLFYNRLKPYLGKIILATFEELTMDFRAPIKRLNKKYNLNYKYYKNTSANNKNIFTKIESEMLLKLESSTLNENMISRPSKNRKNELYKDIVQNNNSYMRAKAVTIYNYYSKYHKRIEIKL